MLATMTKRPSRLKPATPQSLDDPDLLVKLYELIQGEREMVRVYSKALDSALCFVNSDAGALVDAPHDQPLYTAREISFVLSMSAEELRR